MPRSFLVKKKHGVFGAWQWKDSEQIAWKGNNTIGKSSIYLNIDSVIEGSSDVQEYLTLLV